MRGWGLGLKGKKEKKGDRTETLVCDRSHDIYFTTMWGGVDVHVDRTGRVSGREV